MASRIAFKKPLANGRKRPGKAEAEQVLTRLAAELPQSAEACPGLKGRFAGLRKLRLGDYRVVFAIVGDTALVTRIGHRREVYRG